LLQMFCIILNIHSTNLFDGSMAGIC
jgi:hypothetical protein